MLELIFSILPVVVLLVIIYYQDRFEKEPISMLIKAFLGGVAVVIPLSILSLLLSFVKINIANPILNNAFFSFVLSAIPEEVFKFLFLYWIVWKNKNFNEYFDGIVYAVFVSMGFACVENLLYVFQFGLSIVPQRTVLTVPTHFFCAVMMGYYFSLAKFIPEYRKKYIRLSIFIPIIFHGLFNFFLLMCDSQNEILSVIFFVLFLVLVSILWSLGIKRVQRLNKRRSPTEHDNEELINIKAVEKDENKKNKLTIFDRVYLNFYIIFFLFVIMSVFALVTSFFDDNKDKPSQKSHQLEYQYPLFSNDTNENKSSSEIIQKINKSNKATEQESNEAKEITDEVKVGDKLKIGNKIVDVRNKEDSIFFDFVRRNSSKTQISNDTL